MEKLVNDIVSRAIAHGFADAADLVATTATPYLRSALAPTADAVIDPATLRVVISAAADLLGGTPAPTMPPIAPYTEAELLTMAEKTASLARKVLASYALNVAAADAERLLGAVADRVLAAVPAA